MKELNNINKTKTSKCEIFCNSVSQFCEEWKEEGRKKMEAKIQAEIEEAEKNFSGCRQRWSKDYHTPLGTITVKRRAYDINGEKICLADKIVGLPENKWLPEVEEIYCALGVSEEFVQAQKLFTKWTRVKVSDHGLSNRIEAIGEEMYNKEFAEKAAEVAPLENRLSRNIKKSVIKPNVYVGVDGILVPIHKQKDYKEGKVGVIFWEDALLKVSPKRTEIKNREYVATMESREIFEELVYKKYTQVVGMKPCNTILLGDGAHWIWDMAKIYFPDCVQILDFFHVSEYVWDVARELFPDKKGQQKRWVNIQLKRLKKSKWKDVITSLQFYRNNTSSKLKEAIDKIKTYLQNNSGRIDYKTYIKKGYIIGSGVVESSNRRIVTKRLKQSGMYWSKKGANSIMTLRACYLSSSNQWDNFWKERVA